MMRSIYITNVLNKKGTTLNDKKELAKQMRNSVGAQSLHYYKVGTYVFLFLVVSVGWSIEERPIPTNSMHGRAGSTVTATRALCVVLWIKASPSSAQPRSPIQQPGTRRFGQLHRLATGGQTSDRPCNCTKLAVQGRRPSQQLSSPAGSAQGQTHRGLAAMDFKFRMVHSAKR